VQPPLVEASRGGILSKPLPLLLLCALASLYLSFFRLPFTPIWVGYDQMGFLWDATRMWAGERIYRDFFELTPPGIEVVDLLFFRLFGLRNWIPNVHVILLGLSLTWLVAIISRKVIHRGRFLAFLPGFLFLTVAFFPTMGETHRWFSSAALLAALAVVMEERTLRRLVLAGALFGVASLFTQTQGAFAVVGMAIFLFWEWRKRNPGRQEFLKKMACLLASFVVTLLATNAYFVWKAGLDRFLDCIVRFPLLYYPADRVNNSWRVYLTEIPQFPPWIHLPRLGGFFFIHAVLPLVYLLFLVRYRQGTINGEEGVRLMLLNVMGLVMFVSIAPSPSYLRLCTVSPPALITLVFWIRGGGRLQRVSAGLLWMAVFCFGTAHPLRVQMSPMSVLQLPRGPMVFSEESSVAYDLLRWLSSQTRPGDFFFAAGEPGIFFPLALRPVGETPGYDDTDYTRPKQVESAVAALERYRTRLIQWPPDSTDPKLYRPQGDHLEPLRKYVQRNYHLVKRFDSSTSDELEEIWERNE
jgi:hypothetical protein